MCGRRRGRLLSPALKMWSESDISPSSSVHSGCLIDDPEKKDPTGRCYVELMTRKPEQRLGARLALLLSLSPGLRFQVPDGSCNLQVSLGSAPAEHRLELRAALQRHVSYQGGQGKTLPRASQGLIPGPDNASRLAQI
ncbi:unnamed protein product [Lota lota]